ncbi:MAG: DUF6442 family protein [Eubacteriales bacterium]|nr:DUF6442 family protein [Eubacteriales bacterium]
MEKFKNWLLPEDDGREAELTAGLFGELGMLLSFVGVGIYNIVKGKDNQPLLIVILGFLAGKGIGRFLDTHDKKYLLSGILNLISGALYTASYVLENRENKGEG